MGQPPAPTLGPAPLSTGSPARANSTSSLGSVAENSTVWWPPGRRPMISWSCSANPISKSLQGDGGQGGPMVGFYPKGLGTPAMWHC